MPIVDGALELRKAAQDILLSEKATLLPGQLQVMEQFGRELEALASEEATISQKYPKALRNLYMWLRSPGLTSAVLEHNSAGVEANRLIDYELYKHVLDHAKKQPFRSVSAPFNGQTLTMWSSHWQAEELIAQAGQDAVYGDRRILDHLPSVNIDDCNINIAFNRSVYWVMQPRGDVRYRQTPITTPRGLTRVGSMVNALAA